MTKQPAIATRDLAALAFMAQRVNGTLHRDSRVFDPESQDWQEVRPNKDLMRENFALNNLQEQDYQQADAAISAVQGDAVMRVLKGQRLSDFVNSLVELTKKETATARDCGLMAFLPKTYQTQLERADREEQVAGLACSSEYLGAIGNKVTVEFTLIDKRYLQQYNCWSVFGQDADGNCVSFLTQHESMARSGRIQGKIKRLEENQYRNGAKTTTLNYVKEV
jgi:hypothetical protein